MKTILNMLAFIWTLSNNIIGWIVCLINGYKFSHIENFNFYWHFNPKKYPDWFGFVIGTNVITKPFHLDSNNDLIKLKHEETHALQNKILGPLFYPIYILFTAILFLFFWKLHSYYDNPLERWARRSAGQLINIPKDKRFWGPEDRFPWL